MISVRLAPKYYFVELVGAVALYMIALFVRHDFAVAHSSPSLLKVVVLLSPIVPVCLAALAVYRLYKRTDEMHRTTMLENIAFAALFCAVGSISWGFLSDVGLPKAGIGWAWPLMGCGWLLICAWRGARLAIAEQGFVRTAKITAGVVAIVGMPTLTYILVAPALGWPHKPGFVTLLATAIFLIVVGYQTFRRGKECE